MSARRLARAYFCLQGLVALAWWAWLLTTPRVQVAFFAGGAESQWAQLFLLPDLVCLVVGSGLVAGISFRWPSAAVALAWCVTGATVYATLFCVTQAFLHPSTVLAVVLMVPGSLLSGWSAGNLARGDTEVKIHFRVNRSHDRRWILAKTSIQLVFFWSLFLWWIPWGLLSIEHGLSLPRFAFSGQAIVGITVLIFASLLGASSAWTMATAGEGTPLPLDCPRKLVVQGPYRWVRNPMAVAGLLQAVGIGVAWGSPLVIAYILVGLFFWHVVVRPIEEADLARRFDESYADYRRRVWLWLPRLTPYSPPTQATPDA